MKAIFSSFGRRVSVDRRDDASVSHLKSNDSSSFPTSFSSADTAGRGIGDAPTATPDRSAKGDLTNGAWPSKWPGSLRTSDARRTGSQHSVTDAFAVSATGTSSAASTSRSKYPPSSYRQPAQTSTTNTHGAARSLVRKFSTSGRRGSSVSNGQSDSSPHPSNSRLKQPPSASDLGSAATNLKARPSSASVGTDISAMSSTELASRLNELAVANADGLLTDDEYRTLRQAVFDRMLHADKQSMAAPLSNPLPGLALPGNAEVHDTTNTDGATHDTMPSSPTTYLVVGTGRSRLSLGHGERQGSSIRSGQSAKSSSFQNVANMLKKGATSSREMVSQTSQDSHSSQDNVQREAGQRIRPVRRDSEGVASQLSSGDGHSQRASSFRTHWSSAAKSSRASTLGRLRAGSQARRVEAENAAREREEAFSAERTARSLRAVSIHDSGGANGITYDRSPTSLRAEMAPSTMYGAEYVDKSSAEIQAEIVVVQAEGDRMLSTFSTLEETLLAKHAALEPLYVGRVVEKVRESHPLACVSRLQTTDPSPRSQRPAPPSSYRTPRQERSASVSLSQDAIAPDYDTMTSQNIAVFEAELTSIYTQKSAVVKRYQDRLAFLQSKLRSAALREGLK